MKRALAVLALAGVLVPVPSPSAAEVEVGVGAREQKEMLLTRVADTIERFKDLTPAQKARLQALYRRLLGL